VVKRCPTRCRTEAEIEIRQVFEARTLARSSRPSCAAGRSPAAQLARKALSRRHRWGRCVT